MALYLHRLEEPFISLGRVSRRWLSQSRATRPPTAPAQCPNLKHIRQNVDLYANNCRDRNYGDCVDFPAQIAGLIKNSGSLSEKVSGLSSERNRLGRVIAQSKIPDGESGPTTDEVAAATEEADKLADELNDVNSQRSSLENLAQALALRLPNLTSPKTPSKGKDPSLLYYINHSLDRARSAKEAKSHVDIGTSLSILDFNAAGVSTGWGFYFLINEAALLEQALVQFAISIALRRGWKAVAPPSLVYSYLADACGFQPRDQNDEQQIWTVEQHAKDAAKPQRSLAATAEIPLAAMYAGKDIPEDRLPLKFIGSSRCYRAEAGARGVDTKGLYRVHEFSKVEMFAWTNSAEDVHNTEHSQHIFEEMLSIQTEILSALGLPCRVLEMPSSDLGASAYRKVDIEAWFPSRTLRDGGWGELTSASMCTDYQSRRLGTRILEKSGKRGRFPHTSNGTAMAIPRVLAAILEHGWREQEGCVIIPDVLRPYMGGQDAIRPK